MATTIPYTPVLAQPVHYVPICVAVPAFAAIQPIASPKEIPGDVWAVIQANNYFTVRQHLKLLPKSICSCPPCVKQENTYSVYAGLTENAQNEILRIDEVSDDWNRCCCAPYHPVRMEVRPYVPVPGDGTNSDYAHINQDMMSSWNSMSAVQRYRNERDMYKRFPPVMSFQRYDGQRCCLKFPCRCFSLCVCFEFCQDGMDVYAGSLSDIPNKEVGRPTTVQAHQSQMMGTVTQPLCGGIYHPVLELREGNQIQPQGKNPGTSPFATLEGPCFFGGWSECCCDFYFALTGFGSQQQGNLGAVIKKKPTTLAGAFRSLVGGDNSVYGIHFNEQAGLTAAQKSTVIASQILYDYMLFDGSTEKCDSDDNAIYCYICYCLLLGMLVPVKIIIPKKAG